MSTTSLLIDTQQESTQVQYKRNYKRLVDKTSKKQMIPIELVGPIDVAQQFLLDEPGFAQSTARLYRASLAFVFRQMHDQESLEACSMIYRKGEDPEQLAKLRENMRTGRKTRRDKCPRTSAQKTKSISPVDAALLQNSLTESRSKYARATLLWFKATVLTGLRPCEWEYAYIEIKHQSKVNLVVKNAKNTGGRAHGEERRIGLDGLCEQSLALVGEHLDSIKRFSKAKGFLEIYVRCSALLRSTTKRLWPKRRKRPTLYTARHVFSAHAKANFDRVEVAALMGHASIETAYLHYGRRLSNSGGIQVKPDASDIAAVVKRNTQRVLGLWFYEPRLRLQAKF